MSDEGSAASGGKTRRRTRLPGLVLNKKRQIRETQMEAERAVQEKKHLVELWWEPRLSCLNSVMWHR
jgi:hypothetical protein